MRMGRPDNGIESCLPDIFYSIELAELFRSQYTVPTSRATTRP